VPNNPLIDQAFKNYGNRVAGLDLQQADIKNALARRLGISKEDRGKSIVAGRENVSGRGLLHSGIGLMDFADRNKAYDREDDETNATATTGLNNINTQKAQAENDYYTAKLGYEAEDARNAALLGPPPGQSTPSTPIPDLVDPNSARKAQLMEILNSPYDPSDPHNWKKIAAKLEYDKLPNSADMPKPEPGLTIVDQPMPGSGYEQPIGIGGVNPNEPPDPNAAVNARRKQLMDIIHGPDNPADPLGWSKIAAAQELQRIG